MGLLSNVDKLVKSPATTIIMNTVVPYKKGTEIIEKFCQYGLIRKLTSRTNVVYEITIEGLEILEDYKKLIKAIGYDTKS